MRKGKMRRVSALEVLQCCSAAYTPACSDQGAALLHNTAIWPDMGCGGGGLGGSFPFIKDGVLLKSRYDNDMCYIPKQEST